MRVNICSPKVVLGNPFAVYNKMAVLLKQTKNPVSVSIFPSVAMTEKKSNFRTFEGALNTIRNFFVFLGISSKFTYENKISHPALVKILNGSNMFEWVHYKA